MTVQLARRLFTVDDYYRMAEAGILNEDDRVELIEGEIIEMAPIGSHHASSVMRLMALFGRLTPDLATLSAQNPVRIDDYSEPEPDFMLLKPRADFYREAHPTPEDVLLLVEVADASITYDRRVKLPLYARAGIAEVWIVDLVRNRMDVFRTPSPRGYEETLSIERDGFVTPQAFPDLRIHASDVLG